MGRKLTSALLERALAGRARRVPLRRVYSLLAALLLVAGWHSPASAQAGVTLKALSSKDWQSLKTGHAVERRFELPHQGRQYLAAVSYALLDKPCAQLGPLLDKPAQHFAKALPATREVHFVAQDGETTKLRVVHGNAWVQGDWGALYRVDSDGRTARFWIDPDAERDVQDVFGYFRFTDWNVNTCLATAAVAVDPGDGLLASLFRGMIHGYLVRSAGRIQRYVRSSPELFDVSTIGLADNSAEVGLLRAPLAQMP